MRKSTIFLVVLGVAMSFGPALATAPQGKPSEKVPIKQSNKDIREGIKFARQAHKLISEALPVYEGHRLDALKDIRGGTTELVKALRAASNPGNDNPPRNPNAGKGRLNGNRPNGNAPKPPKPTDNESKSKYTPDQIADSDNKLKQASGLLDQAIKALDNADPVYHGERVEAINKFKNAQKQIATALTIK